MYRVEFTELIYTVNKPLSSYPVPPPSAIHNGHNKYNNNYTVGECCALLAGGASLSSDNVHACMSHNWKLLHARQHRRQIYRNIAPYLSGTTK